MDIPKEACYLSRTAVSESLQGRPGIQSAGFATYLPLSSSDNGWSVFIEGGPPLPVGMYNMAKYRPVSAGYFETIRWHHTSGPDRDDAATGIRIGGAAAFPYHDPRGFLDAGAGDGVNWNLRVMNYLVIQRTREFGIRLSLGATPTDVLRLVLRQASALIGASTCLGLAGSVLLVRFIAKLLFGTAPLDPLTYAAVPILLAAVALVASYIPARRATRIDPIVALRCE